MKKTRRLYAALAMLLASAMLLATASYAWFAMNTSSVVDGVEVEAYTDSLYLEIGTENADEAYGTSASFEAGRKELRLVTHGFLTASDARVYTLTFASATNTYYDPTTDTNEYYELADSDVTDPNVPAENAAHNFINVTDALEVPSSLAGYYENPTFTLQTSGTYAEGDTAVYVEKVNDSCYKTVTLSAGAELKGYWKFEGAALDAGTYATDKTANKYFELVNGTYYQVTDLSLGAELANYYTVEATAYTEENFDGTSYFYLKNGTNDEDYSCLGKPTAETKVADYLYWGRAYSNDPEEVQSTNALNIVTAKDGAANYYFYDTLYIRQAEGTTHAENLKVANVNVGGATNSLSAALRVLLVAKSSTGEYNTFVYDMGEDTYTYGDGGDNLFDMLLGNKEEVVTVEVYIYFDGTDDVANNQFAVLNGQTVEIEFAVNEHDYNA